MKKFCAVFALFCVMFLFAACSGGSKESVYGDTDTSDSTSDKTDSDASNTNSDDADSQSDSTADTTPDNGDSADDADSDKPDSDNPDTTPDGGDTAPDNGDTEPDNGDSADDADTSDSQSDDDADTSHGNEPEVGETREADCTGLPANASWNTVSSITQTWNGNEWTPSTEATFSTTSSSTKCRFVCNQNYEWNDSECVAGTRTANCEGLPENAVWNGTASITQTWDDENWVPSNIGTYNKTPNSSECRFQCAVNYNWTGSQCVAGTIQTDCTGLPENALWNTVSNITQSWSGTAWTPSEIGTFNETPSYNECRFVCKTNYSWNNIACAPNELPAVACTGKPDNAVWNSVSNITQTWNGNEWVPTTSATFSETPSTTECRFKCAENYEWNNSQCAAKTREANCTGLPTNAEWNTATKIMQTWSGNAWIPSNTGSFNSSASQSECYFKCKEHYTWNNTVCAPDTQPATCTGLPENAVWNSVSEITQTWNGNGWIPSNVGTFNASASLAECRFKCKDHYSWNASTSKCVADTQPATCTGLPANASWNTASSITQTWNGNAWIPSNAGTYDETPSSNECHFKCNQHYTWNSSTSTCVADTQPANCLGLPTNAVWNTASSITQTWNGNAWIPSNSGTYNETPSSNECHYKCDSGYHWENSACISNTRTANCTGLPTNAEWNTAPSITQNWSSNTWTPSNAGTYNETPSSNECHYKCNSDYHWENSACISNTRTANCTGLPANSVWNTASSITQNWSSANGWQPSTAGTYSVTPSTNQCHYKCDSDYHRENSSCISNTRSANCTGLPTNAEWNTASSITQNWNGNSWIPSNTGSYNASASIADCRFKCKDHYTWNPSTSTCVADTQSANCTGLPQYAEWNTVSTITQTWNGNAWTPSSVGTYNITPSLTECRFECKTNYNWNSSTSKCKAATRSAKCTGLPANASWCSTTITQTWNGSKWTPTTSPSGCYNSTATCTSSICMCRCNSGYAWHYSNDVDHVLGCWESFTKSAEFSEIFSKTCTGQNKCYNDTEEIECPVESDDFFGQDAYYADQNSCSPQNFEIENISNDKIVTDTNTGLQWQQTIPEQTYTWDDAKTYCEELTYADYSDWRLPSPKEFLTIVDNSKYNPAIDSTYFVNMPNDGYFWTSEEYNYSDSNSPEPSAYYFGTYFGDISSNAKTEAANVMCVRGNKLTKSTLEIEKIEEEEIVSDSATELIWQKSYANDKNWQEALSYCENLEYAGYSDWRLPNKNELSSLVKYGEHNPASDFPDMPTNTFWTSTTTAEIKDSAWSMDFYSGYVATIENKSTTHYVRCVRND